MVCNIDIETYSSVDLIKNGVYAYSSSPDFEILMIGYAFSDQEEVTVIDLACGESIDDHPRFKNALLGDNPEHATLSAFNANFERTCLAKYFGRPQPPERWRCTAVKALELGLPRSLAEVGAALGLDEDKLKDPQGKALIRYFSVPCKPTKANGGRTRNRPKDDPEKWKLYIEYNRQDVVAEREIMKRLAGWHLPTAEWTLWQLDQRINDYGVKIDVEMVKKIVDFDEENKTRLKDKLEKITGLANPNSVAKLKEWLATQGAKMPSLTKDTVADALAKDLPEAVREALTIRQALGKTSTAKYKAMLSAVCPDGRLRGMFQFSGARSRRWTGRIVQPQNLARNTLPDLDLARELVADGDFELLETLFGEPSFVFSELVRTAFIPSEGCRFVVSDFAAIEARVIAWIAGEQWRLDAFKSGKDIYCESASRMFGVPVEKHGVNGHLRAQGKVAELACGYQGGVKAMQAMDKGGVIPEEKLAGIVQDWRRASPRIVNLWSMYENAAKEAIKQAHKVKCPHDVSFDYRGGALIMTLPSGGRVTYWGAKIGTNKKGMQQIHYKGVDQNTHKWVDIETYGGRLVENCLAGDTLVFTDHGLVELTRVTTADLLWDGVEWVRHEGMICRGRQKTISVDGVKMTKDHRILTARGWKRASQSKGYHRLKIWVSNSDGVRRVKRKAIAVENTLSMRENYHNASKRVYKRKAKVLRMQNERADRKIQSETRVVGNANMERVALNERAMHKQQSSGLEKLWRAGDRSLRKMAGKLRKLLHGYGGWLSQRADAGSHRRQWRLHSGELPLGDNAGTGKKQKEYTIDKHTMGAHVRGRSRRKIRNRGNNAALSDKSWMARRYNVCEAGHREIVYDLKNAGPRHRFTVWSEAGPMIVHNCVQATARDCLAVAMQRVDSEGYRIVMHIHDEMVVDVPMEDKKAADRITEIMSRPIPWAEGLPLKGDTYETMFYKKD